MTAMDKAAIAWSIAIVAAGVIFAGAGSSMQGSSDVPSALSTEEKAMVSETLESERDLAIEQQTAMLEKEAAAEKMAADKAAAEKMAADKAAAEKMAADKAAAEKMAADKAAAGPKTVNISTPAGTSVPGCEETDSCFLPSSVSIKAGDTVSWSNDDTAAHTVTSGTPEGGPDGTFDSSLFMAGATYDVTFDNKGNYDYFCMVHPWMTGDVKVN